MPLKAKVRNLNLKLSNGYQIPGLALHCSKADPDQIELTVQTGIESGYRHFYFSPDDEASVGNAIESKINEGKIQRNDLYLTTQCKVDDTESVTSTLRKTLENLKTDYLDLYVMPCPRGDNKVEEEDESTVLNIEDVNMWKQMEDTVSQGLTRSIGLAGWDNRKIKGLLQIATIFPVTLEIPVNPYANQEKLISFCRDHGIAVIAQTVLGSYDTHLEAEGKEELLKDSKLVDLSKMYEKTVTQLVLRWLFQRGLVALTGSPLTKSEMLENVGIFDFELTRGDMAYLNTFEKPSEQILLK